MNLSTPSWLNPSAAGQMTNYKGSNATTDLISLQATYRSPIGDAPSGIRVAAMRNAVNGVTTPSPNYIWDSDWVGTPATSPLPIAAGTYLGCNSAVTFNGRIYQLVPQSQTPATNAIGGILSAPVQGGNVGTWRWENPLMVAAFDPYNNPYWVQDSANYAMCRVYNWLYVLGTVGVYYAQIQADGTIGTWSQGLGAAVNGSGGAISIAAGATIAGWQTTPANGSWSGGILIALPQGTSNAALHFHQTSLNDGWPYEPIAFVSTLPQPRAYGALIIDPFNGVFYIGGEGSAGVPQTTVYSNTTMNFTSFSAGTWNTGTALPAARSRFGYCSVIDSWTNGSSLFVLGGITTSGGAAQSTFYGIDSASAAGGANSWNTYNGTALPVATSGCSAAASMTLYEVPQATQTPNQQPPPPFAGPVQSLRYDPNGAGTYKGYPAIFCIGGTTTAVQGHSQVSATDPWWYGPAPELSTVTDPAGASQLGVAGSVSGNADGSYTITFPFADATQGGVGVKKNIGALNNGDQVQVGVQFASSTTGDATPLSWTVLTVGQQPAAPLSVPTNTGQPLATMGYTPGAGASAAQNWRLVVTRNSDSAVMFDSGLTNGVPTTCQIMCAPALASGTAYTATLTCSSQDSVMGGSTNSVTATQSFTPSYAAAGTPTNVTATANHALGSVTLNWSAVSGATGYRVYFRLSSASYANAWELLQDGVTATTITLRDRIPLGQAVDFAVSALNGAGNEGPLSTPALANQSFATTTTGIGFRSLGTDSTGTLTYWTTLSGAPTIASNLASIPASTLPVAGHPDWTDGTYTVRVIPGTGASACLNVHVSGTSINNFNGVRCRITGTTLAIDKVLGGTATLNLASVPATTTAGTAYWLQVVASGTTYTANLYGDSSGAMGLSVATCTATITDAAVQSGQIGLQSLSATSQFGGAYSNVCTASVALPGAPWNCQPAGSGWVTSEPAFYASPNQPFSGGLSASIYFPPSTAASTTAFIYQPYANVPAVAGDTYTLTAQARTVNANGANQGAYLVLWQNGTTPNSTGAKLGGTNGWTLISDTLTTTTGATGLECDCRLSGPGTAYFDVVQLQPPQATISPQAAGYSSMLHVAGDTTGTALYTPLLVDGAPSIKTTYDSVTIPMQGQAQPVVRIGLQNWRNLSFDDYVTDNGTILDTLQGVISAAIGGATLYYRDALGECFPVGLDKQSAVAYQGFIYRKVSPAFVQVPDLNGVYVKQGSAQGIPTLVAGSIPPLDQRLLV